MKKKILALALSALLLLGASAQAELEIVCSLFPQFDFARHIAGEHAKVTQLLPYGADSHGYEPSMRDMLSTDGADLFIYTDEDLESWIEAFSGGFSNVKLIRSAEGIDLEALNEQWNAACQYDHADEDHNDGRHEHRYDAHIWLDPVLAEKMCDNILQALIEADPAHEADFRKNAEAYIQEIRALDAEFQALFLEYPDATLYFGGKFAYSHFLRRYNLGYVTAYATCSDEGEPSARTIVGMVDAMNRAGAKVIFTDEMSSGQVAEAISAQTGSRVMVLHTAHNLSREDSVKGLTYLDLMRENLENIRTALSE